MGDHREGSRTPGATGTPSVELLQHDPRRAKVGILKHHEGDLRTI